MRLPYAPPLTPLPVAEPVLPEPPRRGEPGGPPCSICAGDGAPTVWSDPWWTLHPASACSLPGTVWLASRAHVDSFADLQDDAAAQFGLVAARVERAILGWGSFARVHLYRWGDGGAHFHVWFLPRPLGMIDAAGMMLPLWEDVLPNRPDAELLAAATAIGAAIDNDG